MKTKYDATDYRWYYGEGFIYRDYSLWFGMIHARIYDDKTLVIQHMFGRNISISAHSSIDAAKKAAARKIHNLDRRQTVEN